MAEYIERKEALLKLMQDGCLASSIESIKSVPAADVVPVVRCKGCKYAYRMDGPKEEYDCRKISAFAEFFRPDHFCSYGERRDT